MVKKNIPDPWHVADLNFVEIEISRPADQQIRIEFDCGLRLVIADESQIPLACSTP